MVAYQGQAPFVKDSYFGSEFHFHIQFKFKTGFRFYFILKSVFKMIFYFFISLFKNIFDFKLNSISMCFVFHFQNLICGLSVPEPRSYTVSL